MTATDAELAAELAALAGTARATDAARREAAAEALARGWSVRRTAAASGLHRKTVTAIRPQRRPAR